MRKRIAILGGAFNPIHLGHVSAAYSLSKMFDEVWLQPCYSHNHGKQMEDFYHRLAMCYAAMYDAPKTNVYISAFEIEHKLSGGTLVMFERLRSEYPEIDFYAAIGQDNANKIETFANYEKLIATVPFVVMARTLIRPQASWYCSAPHIFVENINIPEVSSTEIRKALADGKEPIGLDPNVLAYIKERGLYGVKKDSIE